MKKLFCLLLIFSSLYSHAKDVFIGNDYSGTYECIGHDDSEGVYAGTVKLKLVPAQSTGEYGAYDFSLQVPEYGTYVGQAAAEKDVMGINFVLPNSDTKDYGTGIARFNKNKDGKWTFKKYYYEAEYKNGNFGIEECTQK